MVKRFLIVIFVLCLAVSLAGARKALIIGNAGYSDSPLRNSLNDSKAVYDALKTLRFECTLVQDADLRTMEESISSFAESLKKGDEAVFYYSGHGAQVSGENYLIPIGREISTEKELRYYAYPGNLLVDELQRADVSIIVLDACRDNPYKGVRSSNKGLVQMDSRAGSQYIVFSTSQGKTADDGKGPLSPFTGSFVKYIASSDKKIEDMMKDVTLEVSKKTSNAQTPWTSGNLVVDFYFSKSSQVVGPQIPKFITLEGGEFIMGYNSDDEWSGDSPEHYATVGPFMISAYETTQKEWVEIMGYNPSHNVGDYLPVERVTWTQILDYCNRRSVKEGLKPCYSFSFNEGRIICDWLANGYRLPTEAEWEYAARGGSRGRGYLFSGSDEIDYVGWYADNSDGETHVIGTLRPNEIGLYDMTGNVWEFCWDNWCYNYTENSEFNPRDESQHFDGNFRGGSYTNPPMESHNGFRGWGTNKKHNIGFRVVRSVL